MDHDQWLEEDAQVTTDDLESDDEDEEEKEEEEKEQQQEVEVEVEDVQVMSEVHVGCTPPGTSSCISEYTIAVEPVSSPPGNVHVHNSHRVGKDEKGSDVNEVENQDKGATRRNYGVDEGGDLIVPRRKRGKLLDVNCHAFATTAKDTILIHHQLTTSIPCVGLQVWRGALLLGDYLLHKMRTTNELDNVTALELGAGTGLVGILLAQKADLVFLTDVGMQVLDNCFRNVILNSQRFKAGETTVRVRDLDWQGLWPPSVPIESPTDGDLMLHNPYKWTKADLEDAERASIILAADVIYSNNLTDAFFNILQSLMPRGSKRVLFLALEKRYNFSLDDLDVVANGYDHFRTFFEADSKGYDKSKLVLEGQNESRQRFLGKQLDVDQIPQYIVEYERGPDLELWEVQNIW